MSMEVIVASVNPVKVNAARNGFNRCFPGLQIQCIGAPTESGVASQPLTDDETLQGALNRVQAAREVHPSADYWVSFEGGVDRIRSQLFAVAWVAVGHRDDISYARSAALPLPQAVVEMMDQGMELGEANDRLFGTQNSKQQTGAIGLLTRDLLSRESLYADTLILALTRFTLPEVRT
ncbi:uncharacterized conserved protein [Hahella chejuensis KCTC 2396]|uniref:Inosine/xanthosine triphosphatase n=2 Tax=Hahella chejuensis TaxID=158327 RepID=Q2SPR8_HAHCH|nr:uncharacterized conserved protein [Hahella chejuensis KCTC 2396]